MIFCITFIILDIGSIASSGRRSAAYSNIYGDRHTRQGSTIASASEKASMVSGSLASGSITIAGGDVGADGDGVLTPQQLGVMGKFFYFNFWYIG